MGAVRAQTFQAFVSQKMGRGLRQAMEVSGGYSAKRVQNSFPTFFLEKNSTYKLIWFYNHRQQPTQPPIQSFIEGLQALSSHTWCHVVLSCHRKEERMRLGWRLRDTIGLLTFKQSLRDEQSKMQQLLQEGAKTSCSPLI